jgi:hypothetical protein
MYCVAVAVQLDSIDHSHHKQASSCVVQILTSCGKMHQQSMEEVWVSDVDSAWLTATLNTNACDCKHHQI